MFKVGFPELVVLAMIVFIVLGRSRLPDLVALVRPPSRPVASRWSWSDWLLVCAAVLAAGGALSLLTVPRR